MLGSEQGIHQVHSHLKSHQCINCSQSKQHFLIKTSWNAHLRCTYYKMKRTNEKPREDKMHSINPKGSWITDYQEKIFLCALSYFCKDLKNLKIKNKKKE